MDVTEFNMTELEFKQR